MGIDTIVRERHLLKTPFYSKWQKGKVSTDTLQDYARQYYHYEKSLPLLLESSLEHLDDGPARDAVAAVLEDETSHPRPHTELWLQFAEGIGVSPDEVSSSSPAPRTKNLIETYISLCARGNEESLGAIYAYESQVPEVAKAKADGLRQFYGLSDDRSLEFFDLHSTLDIAHAKAIRSGFHDSDGARQSAHLALDAWWEMLAQFEAVGVS